MAGAMGELRRYGLWLVMMVVAATGCGAPGGEDAPSQDEVDNAALTSPLVFTATVGVSTVRLSLLSYTSTATEVDITHRPDPSDPVLTGWLVNGTLINQIRYGNAFVTLFLRQNVHLTQIDNFTSGGVPVVEDHFQ